MQGRIIKGIAGFYYVATVGSGTYACKARGIFRKDGQKPLVGDLVEIEVTDEKDMEASVREILPRKNELLRPAVANVDQALVFFALRDPDPDALLIDRFLLSMEHAKIPTIICFNKTDLSDDARIAHWQKVYEPCGYPLLFCSAKDDAGTEALKAQLKGKLTVIAGPSGAGKSSITNLLQSGIVMETGSISKKLGRGRHTTRHSELIPLDENSFLCDTPGFSSLYIPDLKKEQLQDCFPEIRSHAGSCRFVGCAHISEPDCGVKEAVEQGEIAADRYQNYCSIYAEMAEQEKRRY